MSKFDKSLSSVTTIPKEAIKIIADNMISTRPVADVVYRPYHKSEIYRDLPRVGPRCIDIKKLHPEIKVGDIVYISTVLESCDDAQAKINFWGDAKLYLEGKEIYDANGNTGLNQQIVELKKGDNPITFAVRCTSENECEFKFMPSVRYYLMWAKFYLLNVRAKSPLPEFMGEDGVAISRIYKDGEKFDGSYVYPMAATGKKAVDFNESYAKCKGKFAYAMTNATEDTTLSIEMFGEGKILVNGEACNKNADIALKKGDTVIVKVKAKDGKWGFDYSCADIKPEILTSSRGVSDDWIVVGAFGGEDDIDTPMGPECGIDFAKPFTDREGNATYWKLAAADEFMRPTLASRFFGQWFYALMVGTHGLYKTSLATGDKKYLDYFINSTQILASYYDYIQYDAKMFGQATFLELSVNLDNLDAIGSMGRNLCELYKLVPREDALKLIDTLADAAMNDIPRFDDGTYHRETDMWADDLFMSCPFLVRYAALKGDESYADEVVRQLLGFKKKLWMADQNIMSHIYFLDTNEPNRVPWGRGNGWVYVSLTDALEQLPKDTKGYDELMSFYLEFTEGIIKLQDSEGLWHQVLNIPTSYQETSCTGMYLLGLCRGINNGWISPAYKKYADKAYLGLLEKKISSVGNVYDVCMGSSNSKNAEYYVNLGAVDNDDHGTGVILTAINEYIKACEK